MRNQDKFRGCLIGGAAGDALGYAVEFMRDQDIFRRYSTCLEQVKSSNSILMMHLFPVA